MRVYKKKTIRRMKWYGVILVLSGIPLGIGMGRSLEEGRIFLLEESQIYAQKLYLPLFSYQKEQESEREEIFRLPLHVWMPLAGYLEDQTEKRGKEEPTEVLEDEETIAWILQCQANDEHAVDEEGKLVGAVIREGGSEGAVQTAGERRSRQLSERSVLVLGHGTVWQTQKAMQKPDRSPTNSTQIRIFSFRFTFAPLRN